MPRPDSHLWKLVIVIILAFKMSHVAQKQVNDKGLSSLPSVSRDPTAAQRILGSSERLAAGLLQPWAGWEPVNKLMNE